MDTLTVALASLGGVVLAGVIAHGAWQARRAGPKQASDPREEPSASAPVRGDEPGLDDADAAAVDDPSAVSPRRLSKRVPLQLDALIDAFATFTLDGPVSAEAIAPHLAAKRFVGSKLFLVEGLNSETGLWEAPAAGQYAWLNSGTFVARRELNAAAKVMVLRVYDVSSVAVSALNAIAITKPADVAAQPWGYRRKDASEQQGEMLITENVTLAPSQSVGSSKRGTRNIIPITGGTLSGRLAGKILMGGADYQILSPPATIDAHYLWQTDDGEIIIVRNGGSFGSLVPTFETRVDGPYAYLNSGRYLSSNPGRGQGGVALTFYESSNAR